jgi:hypothetical protein
MLLLINIFCFLLIVAYIFFFPFYLLDIFLFILIFFIIFLIVSKKYLIKIIIPLVFFMLFSLTITNIVIHSEKYNNYCNRIFNNEHCFLFFNKVDELKIKRKITNDRFPNTILIK